MVKKNNIHYNWIPTSVSSVIALSTIGGTGPLKIY